jgi:DNA repair ATPase RecN
VSRIKGAIRALLRPIVRALLRPVNRRIDEMNRRVDELSELTERLDRHLPIVENAIESQNAELRSRARSEVDVRAEMDRLREDLARAQQQIDAIRRDAATRLSSSTPVDLESAGRERRHEEEEGALRIPVDQR